MINLKGFGMGNFERDVINRLTRIESKLVRGYEEMGISLSVDEDWLSVDDASRVVYVSTMGRSLQVILGEMRKQGATQWGKDYDVVHRGEVVGTITFVELK